MKQDNSSSSQRPEERGPEAELSKAYNERENKRLELEIKRFANDIFNQNFVLRWVTVLSCTWCAVIMGVLVYITVKKTFDPAIVIAWIVAGTSTAVIFPVILAAAVFKKKIFLEKPQKQVKGASGPANLYASS